MENMALENHETRELRGLTAFFGSHRIALLGAIVLIFLWRITNLWNKGIGPEIFGSLTVVRLYIMLTSMAALNYLIDLSVSGLWRQNTLRKYSDLRRVIFAVLGDTAMVLLIVLLFFFRMPYFNYTP